MKLANLYNAVGKLGSSKPDPEAGARRIELANSMTRDLLDEYARLEAYENKYSPTFEDEAEDAYAVEVLRSIGKMFEGWLADAEPVYETLKQSPGARQSLPRLEELRDAVGFAHVRLLATPEEELEGVRQVRRGEVIHYASVEELRNDLRAQRRP